MIVTGHALNVTIERFRMRWRLAGKPAWSEMAPSRTWSLGSSFTSSTPMSTIETGWAMASNDR